MPLVPLCQTEPLWASLAGLAGPLTGYTHCRTPRWTYAPVGLERQLTFRPYWGLLATTEFVPFSKASRTLSDELKRTAGDPPGCFKWLVQGLQPEERVVTDDQTDSILIPVRFCYIPPFLSLRCSVLDFFFKWLYPFLMLTLAFNHYWWAFCRSISGRLNRLTPVWSLSIHSGFSDNHALPGSYLMLMFRWNCEGWARES